MRKLTGYNLASFINQLPKNRDYNYINPRTKGLIRIIDVTLPEGPITIKRWTPSKGETAGGAETVSISAQMIWRYANAFAEGQPLNIDRVLGASYNTRSVLESLVAYTPYFYHCRPGRLSDIDGHAKIESGHKHLLYLPDEPHENGVLAAKDTNVTITEVTSTAVYESLSLPESLDLRGMDIEAARRHAQIQIALYLIGLQLGYRTWIAQNDKGIIYNDRPLAEQAGIVKTLSSEPLVAPFDGAVGAGLFIDCIWFKNGRLMPAVMEVEHTTGITSGLTRMLNFQSKMPPLMTRWVIVAPDDDRRHVIAEAGKPIFQSLQARYFPYSAVEELFIICQRRRLRGITEEFLDCYMEKAVA
ncbi:MAG: hypothetical protein LBG71_06265 [Clostridiales Family XIII bacterium]|jgi:type II restriction enzyme|nr:hypothetical protein [Clostridiales Family XIII bacterium]